MNPGDLVRVAKSFKRSDEKPWERIPDWSGDSVLGLVLELSKLARSEEHTSELQSH